MDRIQKTNGTVLISSAGYHEHGLQETQNARRQRGKLSLVLTIAVVMLVVTSGLWTWSTIRSAKADVGQKQGLLRRAQLATMVGTLQEAESSLQGYFLSRDTAALSQFHFAIQRLPWAMDSARRDTVQARRLTVLRPRFEERLALLPSGGGREVMNRIRVSVAGMNREEDSLAARWTASVRTATEISLITNFFGGLLVICFLILAGRTISRDFKDRIRIEEERDRFFMLSLDLRCIAKSDGYFKRINPVFTATLGWSRDELLSRPFLDFVHPEDRAATLREVEQQTVAGEPVLRFENRYQHKDGSWRVLSWRSVPQPGGLMFATARDVTDARRMRSSFLGAGAKSA